MDGGGTRIEPGGDQGVLKRRKKGDEWTLEGGTLASYCSCHKIFSQGMTQINESNICNGVDQIGILKRLDEGKRR